MLAFHKFLKLISVKNHETFSQNFKQSLSMTFKVKLLIVKKNICIFIMLAFIPNFDIIRFQTKKISK